jgi:phosphoribosylformimino-5-aminoimidazole carboxamide ribotide isomerase
MIAIPAVDLRDGACVQLVGGSYDRELVRVDDPVAAARNWRDAGFSRLHVVDLDAALDRGTNAPVVERIIREAGLEVQVGGGIRGDADVARVLGWGATSVVVGTRALTDLPWLAEQALRFPGRIIVAADVRAGRLTVRGWTEGLSMTLEEVLAAFAGLPLAGVLVTAVDVEGQMRGPSLELVERAVAATDLPVLASGGVSSREDLRALAQSGADAAVIGMALYTGALNARSIAREFGE